MKHMKTLKGVGYIVFMQDPTQSYGASLAIWDHLPFDTGECAPP